jgi:hypothetical protein
MAYDAGGTERLRCGYEIDRSIHTILCNVSLIFKISVSAGAEFQRCGIAL